MTEPRRTPADWQYRFAAVSVALVALAVSIPASGETVEEAFSRFLVYNDCGPMRLLVEGVDEDATKIGLTKEALQAAAESRLRAARLYDRDADPYLYISVNVVGPAFGVGVEFNKYVFDYASEHSFLAATWNSRSAGTHGGDAGYLVSSISQHLDIFLVEYLRVNEEACEAR